MNKRMDGKVVIVVGATRGIGAATSRRLAQEGAVVILGGISVERGQAFAEELKDSGGKAEFRLADLSNGDSLLDLMNGVAHDHGRIDGLFNNGADLHLLDRDGDVLSTDPEIFARSLTTNLTGYFLSCRAAIPHMLKAGGGAIVQTSSLAASRGDSAMVGYCASKAGVDALTRHVAVRFAKQKIRCNAIQPGMIMVENAVAMGDALPLELILKQTAGPRLGEPEDIASAATFLLSDDAAFINGQIIRVDGGMSIPLLGNSIAQS